MALCRRIARLVAEVGQSRPEASMYTEARAASAWRASGALGAPQVHSIHSIWLKGHPTELPLRGQGRPGPDHSLEEFQYSAGFFDGAGHVVEDVSGWRLELTLPSEQQDVLLRFHDLYGGILSSSEAHSSVGAQLKWALAGAPSRRAAAALSGAVALQRPQLLLAAHWRCKKAPASPSLSKRAALAACRWMRPESPAEFTWPYFAGLFDALGCIVCINDLILLELRHSSSSYLERLRRFLLGEAHGASDVSQLVSVRHFHRSSRLVVHEPSSRITLRRLLQAGSILRREAVLVLSRRAPRSPKGLRRLLQARGCATVAAGGSGSGGSSRIRLVQLSQSRARHLEARGRQSEAEDRRHALVLLHLHCASRSVSITHHP
ncbi:unnamed protein product [Symbiodinium natans]|uniref:Homing endonuclease LAGLIDADG domain-containing protein n=1 Tax=Symbiodinium natans TaxID=878477 RepID=A0A812L6A9_9DINO|nr:unnamed protein product [Symbiodinium natans]